MFPSTLPLPSSQTVFYFHFLKYFHISAASSSPSISPSSCSGDPPPPCVLFGFLILSWISWMKITYRSVVPASGYTTEENVLFFSQRPLKTACSYSGKDEISWGNQYLPLMAWGWIASSCVGPLSANRNVLRPRMPKHCLVLKTAFHLAPFHLPALAFLSSSSSLMFPERSAFI